MTTTADMLGTLHELTLETYRLRIHSTAEASGYTLPPHVIDALARMTDMCAAERVLDEADYSTVPGWEHPVNRAARERLAHAEAVILALAGIPSTLRASIDPECPNAANQLAMIETAYAQTGAVLGGATASALSPTIAATALSVVDHTRDLLEASAMDYASDGTEASTETAQALISVADELCAMRAAVFRPVDAHVSQPA